MISAAYLKVLMNFFQIIGIIALIKISFNSEFYTFVTSQKICSGFFFNVISLDCLLGGYFYFEQIIFKKYFINLIDNFRKSGIYLSSLINALIPFILLFVFICYFLYKKLKSTQIFKYTILTFTILVTSMQGSIFSSLFAILSCEPFESENEKFYYISSYLSERCYTQTYNKWVYFMLFPTLSFYIFILPSISFIYMYQQFRKKMITSEINLMYIGFLINGYRRQKIFWEFWLFFRKILLNLTVIFLNPFPAALLVLAILFLSLFFQYINKPFLTKKLNKFEFLSIFSCAFILILALFSENMPIKFIQILCIPIMFVINAGYILMVLKICLIFKLNDAMKKKPIKIFKAIVDKFFNG